MMIMSEQNLERSKLTVPDTAESSSTIPAATAASGIPVTPTASLATAVLGRHHARRLREVYRSAGWPCLDTIEVELLATGLLERTTTPGGHDKVRLTDAGIHYLAQAFQKNRQTRSAHEALVDLVAQNMSRDGRVVWTKLKLRARLPAMALDEPARWKICMPDVFSIRNTTVAAYLEPVVHEIKVSRADLLGDLKLKDKRDGYLDVAGQCWYVLGCDSRGYPIGKANEIPLECGVMVAESGRLEVMRNAPKRSVPDLSFALWMALAKAKPLAMSEAQELDGSGQSMLLEQDEEMDAE